jgi:hypothetical protein
MVTMPLFMQGFFVWACLKSISWKPNTEANLVKFGSLIFYKGASWTSVLNLL